MDALGDIDITGSMVLRLDILSHRPLRWRWWTLRLMC